MKTLARILALLGGLSVLMLGAPLEERFARARAEGRSAAPTPGRGSPNPTPTRSRGLAPLAILAGGNTCGTATVISSVPYSDSGDTGTGTDNIRITGCPGPTFPGPDLVYQFTVLPGNNLTFTLTPEPNYDPAIYIRTACPQTSGTCVAV